MPMRAPSISTASLKKYGSRDSVRNPWATVVRYGDSRAARSRSTWIHWSSPVASANSLMCACVTSIQSVSATSFPAHSLSRSTPGITIFAIGAYLIATTMNATAKLFLAIGGGAALLAVALGAFGAHALRSRLTPDMLAIWCTGIEYHLFHAIGLLAVGLVAQHADSVALRWSGWLMVAGIALFSGSLYLLA